MIVTITELDVEGLDKPAVKIELEGEAKGSNIEKLRESLPHLLENPASRYYLDVRKVSDNDLGFVNEIIHLHYTLAEYSKEFILLYRKGSAFESWIETSGIDKFIKLAVTP